MRLKEIPILGFFLVVWTFFCRKILISSGVIMGGDWLFPFTIAQTQVWAKNGLYLWTNVGSLLGVAQPYMMPPIHFCFWLLSKLGLEGEVVTKGLLLFVPGFSGFTVYFWCRFLKIRVFPSLFAGFYFITTALFFNYMIMGWAFVLLSGALLPFALIPFSKSIREDKESYAVLAGLVYFGAFCLASQAVVWYAITFSLLSFFTVRSLKEFRSAIKAFVIVFSVFFLMNGSWIAPLLAHSDGVIGQTACGTDVPLGQRLSCLNILRLWGSLFNYQYEISFPPSLFFLTLAPALFSYTGLLLKKKNRMVLFFAVLTFVPCVFFFLQKIYYLIPFTIVIRDPSRFIILSSLAYSVLIAYTIEGLMYKQTGELASASRWIGKLCACMLVALVGLNSYPFWKGGLYGAPKEGLDIRLRTHQFSKEYFYVEKMLNSSEEFKAFYLPTGGFVGLLNKLEFHGPFHEFADIFSGFSPVPGTVNNKGDRRNIGSLKVFDEILEQEMSLTQAGRFPSLINLANIKYIIARLNMYSNPLLPSVRRIVQVLKTVPWLTKIYDGKHIVAFQNEHVLPRIYATSKASIISGDLSSLLPLSETSYLGNYPALIFLKQNAHQAIELLSKPIKSDLKETPLLLANKDFNDFVLESLKDEVTNLSIGKDAQDFKIDEEGGVVLLKLKRGEKVSFDVKSSCEYEIWSLQEQSNGGLIQMDSISLQEGHLSHDFCEKWMQRAQMRLEAGRHEVRISGFQEGSTKNLDFQKEHEFLLVSKPKIEEVRERFKNYCNAFFIYHPRNGSEVQGLEKEIGRFRLPLQNQEYQFEGDFSLKRSFKRVGKDFSGITLTPVLKHEGFLSLQGKGLEGVTFDAARCRFSKIWVNGVLKIKTYFDSALDEYARINYSMSSREIAEDKIDSGLKKRIDLKKYPFLALTYKIQDPSVQTIQVSFEVQIENNIQKFSLIPHSSYLRGASTHKETFFTNLLSKAQDEFPGRKHYYLTDLQILPHKIWDVDCSKNKKGWYLFKLYDLKMVRHLPPQIQQPLKRNFPHQYFYVENDELRPIDKLEKIPLDQKFCFKVTEKSYLDIQDTSEINLILEDYKFDRAQLTFGLGKERTAGEMVEVKKSFPVIPLGYRKKTIHISLRKIFENDSNKIRFPRCYWIELVTPGKKRVPFRYELRSNYFEEYEGVVLKFDEKSEDVELFKVDGLSKRISPPEVSRVDKDSFKFNSEISFSEASDHQIEFLKSEKFQWNWLMILPKEEHKAPALPLPSLEFKQINPTRYVVNVKNAQGPFWMIFSESFHPSWKAYIRTDDGQRTTGESGENGSALWSLWKDSGKRVEITDHLQMNGFANGWWVDPTTSRQLSVAGSQLKTEDFQIVIEFTLQRWFELGLIVSGMTLITALGYLSYCLLKPKKNKVE